MIIIDTRENKIQKIIEYFEKINVQYSRQKLNCGDYTTTDNLKLCVERKANLQEVCGNLCQGKARFYREFERAKTAGIKLILLIEQGDIQQLSDVANWQNPRLKDSPRAITGCELMERLYRLKMAYGIDILFCDKQDTGKIIIELLGVDTHVREQ